MIGILEPRGKEIGYVFYNLMQNQTNPEKFVFVEEWQSQTDLQTHLASAHIKKALAKWEG